MNCKPGDLAMIVKSEAGNEGKIVRCIKFVGVVEILGDGTTDNWETDTELTLIEEYSSRITQEKSTKYFSDSWLRPLRGDLLDNETTTSKELEAV